MTSLYKVLKNYNGSNMQDDSQELFRELMEPEPSKIEEQVQEEQETQDAEKETEENVAKWAEQILEAARMSADKIEEEARQAGFQQGEEEGYKVGAQRAMEEYQKQFDEEMVRVRERIEQIVKEVSDEKDKLLEYYLDDLKNIALAIGEKIVQISLKSSQEVVGRMIVAATEKLKKAAWAKIYIGRGQGMMDIQGDAEFLRNLSKLADNVKIIMMDEEETGTCIVELPGEVIDVSVGTQLENIKEILNNARL